MLKASEWICYYNYNRSHDGLGGKSPAEALREIEPKLPSLQDPEGKDILFLPPIILDDRITLLGGGSDIYRHYTELLTRKRLNDMVGTVTGTVTAQGIIVKRVTIKDVASHAGVSYQTVSRVINDRPDVAPETRRRVLQAIEELGYQPSAIARSLVSQRTHTLGLITADFSDYFFTQVIAGAEIAARERAYFFILGSSERRPEDEPVYVRLLTERQVEGILFARPSTEKDTSHIRALLHQGVPLVTTAYHLEGEKLTVVDVDNVDGGQQATECLVKSGHRKIGLIEGPAGWKSVDDRTRGYKLALERGGIHFREGFIEGGDWSEESGYKAMKRLLQKAPQITALFAQNDRMAIGAMRALREAGRRIPEDVAMVGYDDIPMAAYCEPPLSTMRQPMREVGRVAVDLLLEAIENPQAKKREVLLKTELLVRESSGGGR